VRTYPVFLMLEDEPALVVGGGEVAERKVIALLEAGAVVTVVAPETTDGLKAMQREGRIRIEKRTYRPGEAVAFVVTVAATDDNDTNRTVAADAKGAGRLVNVVDVPELCNFIVPSTVRRGELVVAISTGGGSPALARRLREEIDAHIPQSFAALLDILAEFRLRVRDKYSTEEERKRILTEVARSPHVDTYLNGDEAPLKEYLKQWI
jgi:precorrin-2 dehydrogenase / sirohydrochlorin ferrochelatase